jgi:hypothetical protein
LGSLLQRHRTPEGAIAAQRATRNQNLGSQIREENMPADIEPDLVKSAEALRQNVVGGLIECSILKPYWKEDNVRLEPQEGDVDAETSRCRPAP